MVESMYPARGALVALLACGLVLLSPGAQRFVVAQAPAADDRTGARAALDRLVGILGETRASIDRRLFDLEAFALEQAFAPPATIADWVRDEVAYEHYDGLLRGPDGTFMSRAGNAVDQAVLLARLLGDAGYDARVARGTLDVDDATRLVRSMAAAPPKVEDGDTLRPRLEELEAAIFGLVSGGATAESRRAPVDAEAIARRTVAVAERLNARLADEGIVLGGGDAERDWIDAARDYAWVEYRDPDADGWTEAHPAFVETPPEGLHVEERWTDAVPAEAQHRLRLRVGLDRRRGNESETVVLVDDWERPVANLVGVPLTFAVAPISHEPRWETLDDGRLGDEASPLFAVTFNGALLGAAFDLDGNVVPVDVAGQAPAGLFREVGGAFESAASALGSLGGGGANDGDGSTGGLLELEGVWVEYGFVEPGGRTTLHVRDLLERDVVTAQAVQVATVAVGGLPRAYVVDQLLAALEADRPLLEAYVERAFGDDDVAPLPSDVRDQQFLTQGLQILHAFDAALGTDRRYRARPSMAIRQMTLVPGEPPRGISRVDIVENQQRTFRADGGRLAVDVERAMRAGIAETLLEEALHGPLLGLRDAPDPGAGRHLLERMEGQAELATLHPGDVGAAERLELGPEASRSLTRDLEAGYAVALPGVEAADATEGPYWWRIDPATGATLGVGPDGRGVSMTEWTIVAIVAGAFLAVMMHVALAICDDALGVSEAGHAGEHRARILMRDCGIPGKLLAANYYVWQKLDIVDYVY
jgi:hypothetical protein